MPGGSVSLRIGSAAWRLSACGIYVTGGATAVLEGWRGSTIDVDVRFEPESDALDTTG